MSQIDFVTDWTAVCRLIRDHSETFPRSSLALSMLDYLKAVTKAKGQNRSFAVLVDNAPVAVAVGWVESEGWRLLDRPTFIEFSPRFEYVAKPGALVRSIVSFMKSSIFLPDGNVLSFLGDGNYDSPLMRELMSISSAHHLTFEGTVDLRATIEEITGEFRSGHRQSVRKGRDLLTGFQIFGQDIELGVFSTFRELHRQEAGRITRNNESWEEMYTGLQDSRAFLAVVTLETEVVGCSYFWVSRHAANYGHAAYKREYFRQLPIAHFVLFKAMERLKEIGIEKLFLEEVFLPQGTQKEKSIAAFKRGFTKTTEAIHTVTIQM